MKRVAAVQLFAVLLALLCWHNLTMAQSCNTVNFSSPINSQTGNNVANLIIADFNRDGFNDIVTLGGLPGDSNEDTISIVLGQGNGSFSAPRTIMGPNNGTATGNSPISGLAADFNNDGNLDLLIVNARPALYQIFIGSGNGFTKWAEFGVRSDEALAPAVPTIADVNNDGILDIIALSGSTVSRKNGNIAFYLGEANGTFEPGVSVTPNPANEPTGTPSASQVLAARDVNNDGRTDIILSTSQNTTQRVRVILAQSDNSFNFANEIATSITPNSIPVIADVNGDSIIDLLTLGRSTNQLTVQLGRGGGRFGSSSTYTLGQNSGNNLNNQFLKLADFNSDNILDLAIKTSETNSGFPVSDYFAVYLGRADGSFDTTNAATRLSTTNSSLLEIADLNNDLRTDVVMHAQGNGNTIAASLNTCGSSNNCSTLAITTESLAAGTVGTSTTQTVTASGGSTPYSFSVTAGSLPNGLNLSNDGTLSGTPTSAGSFSFTVSVTDANRCSANRTLTMTINDQNSCPTMTMSPDKMPTGSMGATMQIDMKVSGGTAPYTFALTQGIMPPGMTMTSTGTVSGTFTKPGTYSFLVTATDASGCSSSRPYSMTVICDSMRITTTTLAGARLNTFYRQLIQTTADNSNEAPRFYINHGRLPTGLSLSSDGIISGTPTESGMFNFNVQVTGADGCSDSRTYSISVK